MASLPAISIQVVSDIMCPWCWVGKRKLEAAMRLSEAKYSFRVIWEPYLLRPDMPEEGMEKPETYKDIKNHPHLYKAGQAAGIDFTGKCSRFPNTIKGHAFLAYLKGMDDTGFLQNQAAEKLFEGYFTLGRYPDDQFIAEVAQQLSLDGSAVIEHINSKACREAVLRENNHWRGQGVTGVPFFIMNGKHTFSGAQDPSAFLASFEKVALLTSKQ